jgi:hypothetical protein
MFSLRKRQHVVGRDILVTVVLNGVNKVEETLAENMLVVVKVNRFQVMVPTLPETFLTTEISITKSFWKTLFSSSESECREAACEKRVEGATSGTEAADRVDPVDTTDYGEQVDCTHEDQQGGERGNEDKEGDPNKDLMQSPRR